MEDTTAPKDSESLRKTNEVLLCRNKALRVRSEKLTRDKEVLRKRMNDLMGQDTQDTQDASCVPETMDMDEINFQEQSTTPGDCESFHRANKFLSQKNHGLCIEIFNICRDITVLRKKIHDLISQKTQVSSSVSEISTATEFADEQNQIPKSKETQTEAAHSFDELQKLDALLERVKVLEEWQCEEQDLGSEPDRLSLWRRFVRFFIPGWRRRYSSRDTVEYVESGEQAREETQRRPTLWGRFVNFCTRRFRRRRT